MPKAYYVEVCVCYTQVYIPALQLQSLQQDTQSTGKKAKELHSSQMYTVQLQPLHKEATAYSDVLQLYNPWIILAEGKEQKIVQINCNT